MAQDSLPWADVYMELSVFGGTRSKSKCNKCHTNIVTYPSPRSHLQVASTVVLRLTWNSFKSCQDLVSSYHKLPERSLPSRSLAQAASANNPTLVHSEDLQLNEALNRGRGAG